MKRIGLISDTHNHLDPKVEKYFKDVDEIWHAGDIGELEITDQLSEIAPVRAVYGNIDGHKVRAEFPLHQKFTMEGVRVWMTHIGGKPYVYDYRIREDIKRTKPDLFICGHSHICKVQLDKRLQTLYMNPGAAGVHGFHKVKTILRFSLDQGKIKDLEVVELGPRARG
jgi:putative phosphoesterase